MTQVLQRLCSEPNITAVDSPLLTAPATNEKKEPILKSEQQEAPQAARWSRLEIKAWAQQHGFKKYVEDQVCVET